MKTPLLIMTILFFLSMANAQTEVGKVVLPNLETIGEHKLVLNGAGLREKWWIDIFVGGLYLSQKSSDAKAILNGEKAFAVRLYVVSGLINSERMSKAVDDGFRKSTQGNSTPFLNKMNQLKAFFSQEEIQKDDVFDFLYEPTIGVVIYKNDKKIGEIEGEDFEKAFFGIWLSENPAMPEMKKALLGLAKND